MIQLIYLSQSKQHLSPEQLNKILVEARASNSAKGLTGMLLYRNGLFMQVIEGEAAAVDQLYENIKKDGRHHSVHLILREEISKREFADWTMGFKNISREVEGANDFMDNSEYTLNHNLKASAARKILAQFRDIK